MQELQEAIDFFVGLWVCLVLFVTCPVWGVPYIIYQRVKNGRREQ